MKGNGRSGRNGAAAALRYAFILVDEAMGTDWWAWPAVKSRSH